MLEKYVFNETLKRLEPISAECSFCKNGIMDSMSDCYFTTIYKEHNRTNIIVYRSVEFREIEIGIPRCNTCAKAYQKANDMSSGSGFLLGIAIFITGYFLVDNLLTFILLVGGIAFIIGTTTSYFIKKYYIDKAQILSEKKAIRKDHTINTFVYLNGWTNHRPTA